MVVVGVVLFIAGGLGLAPLIVWPVGLVPIAGGALADRDLARKLYQPKAGSMLSAQPGGVAAPTTRTAIKSVPPDSWPN